MDVQEKREEMATTKTHQNPGREEGRVRNRQRRGDATRTSHDGGETIATRTMREEGMDFRYAPKPRQGKLPTWGGRGTSKKVSMKIGVRKERKNS